MKSLSHTLIAGALIPGAAHAELMTQVLGPVSPVYKKTEDGTAWVKSGWFPDAQFPYIWGGANDPDTNMSWWMERRKGSMHLDYAEKSGDWIPQGPPNSPDDRGTWIQSVYRPVDVKPSLAGTSVTLKLYADNAEHGATPVDTPHVIDADYLVGFAHTEDWDGVLGKVVNYSRTLYSFDNGKTWRKGPFVSMGLGVIDYRTDPANPRYVNRKMWTADIAKGTDNYQDNPSVFTDGNLYGTSGILWSRYLGKYLMMFGYNGAHGKTLNFTSTDSFTSYGEKTFISIWKNAVPGRSVVAGAGDYPTLLGGFPEASGYPIPFNMEVGQLGWVYNKSGGGLSGRAIHFIKPVEQEITWQGGTAAGSLVAVIVEAALAESAAGSGIYLSGREVPALGDEDGDGIANLIESVTGTRLDVRDAGAPGRVVMEYGRPHFIYTRDAAKQAQCGVEWSENLTGGWNTDGVIERVLSTTPEGIETVRADLPEAAGNKCFMRLRVTSSAAGAVRRIVAKGAAGSTSIGGGITVAVSEDEIPGTAGAASTWTFTRGGSTASAQTVSFGLTGSAVCGVDYTVSGTASLSGGVGTIVIPAGQSSAAMVTTMAGGGIGKSIVVSAAQALELAASGNWTQATGTFTGMADEVHSLHFGAAAGGVFQNDIPVTKRVRSITFDAGSGDHTINGNALQVEAATRAEEDKTTSFYGITQKAAATARFTTDIHTRTAALYLRPEVEGGRIELEGAVDIMGTGGVVVSGAGDVAIRGEIDDSGYKDFTSGQAEYVASVNEGRLIMVGDGTLVLAGDNGFTGRTDLGYGTTRVENYGALRNSVVTLNKHLALTATTDFKVGGLNGWGNLDLGANDLTLGHHNPPDCYPAAYTGIISGSGSVTKLDTSTQKIGALNTHSGGTFIKAGTLEVPPSNNTAFGSGTVTLDGGTLKVAGPLTLSNTVQVGAGGGIISSAGRTVTFNGALTGGGDLSAGNAALVLNSAGTFTGTLTTTGSVRLGQTGALGSGVLMLGGKLLLSADQTLAGLTTTTTASTVDTGAYSLGVTGAINVAAGRTLVKAGTGALEWSGSSAGFAGALVIQGGTLRRVRSGDFTLGNVEMGGAKIALAATGSGSQVIDIAAASGKKLTLNGASTLALDKGTAGSLVVNIGSATNTGALVLTDSSTATLMLGAGTKLYAHGESATTAGETYSPAVVLAGTDLVGSFAVYSTADGFTPFTGSTARTGSFTPAAGGAEISNITGTATLAANATVKGLRISAAQAVAVTSRVLTFSGTGGKAGLLLNNGSVNGGTLAFGTNKAYLYTSGQNAAVTSTITGSGGVVLAGEPGTKINLNLWSPGYSGRLTVAGTTAMVSSTNSLGASGTPITIDGGGTMSFPYSINANRAITFGSGGAAIEVADGAVFSNNGALSGSGEFRKRGAGTLRWTGGGSSSTGAVVVEQGLLDYAAYTIQGSTGPVTVLDGAAVLMNSTAGGYANHDYLIAGNGGTAGDGALAISGGGKTSGPVTLSADARIRAVSGATFTFEGPISGAGNNLEFNGSGKFTIAGVVGLDTASLTLTGTPYINLKDANASLTCGALTTAAGSTLEVNTPNARIASAGIGGVLAGNLGTVVSAAPVVIANGGTIAGGLLNAPGFLIVDGDLQLSTTSTVHAYLKGGTGAASDGKGAQHGQILVTGAGDVDGTLKLVLDATYAPAAGDEIYVMLRNAGTGSFSQVVVVEGSTTTTFSGAPGTSITIGGRTGVLQYSRHSSINLSSPDSASDISIKFP